MSDQQSSSLPLVDSMADLRQRVARARSEGRTIGLVPTMGALHEGHLSLVDAAVRDCCFPIVTIFVNPAQFGPNEDFGRYPRTLEADLRLLAGRGTALVFAPKTESMYRPGHATYVEPAGAALGWEGEFRPGHFRGVATIVLKLFNLVQPDRAYFGRKDFQQAAVVRQMVADLDVPVHIEVCPIIRESDGLAMSSRNIYLSADERQRALAISASLRAARELVAAGTRDSQAILTRMRTMLDEARLPIDYLTLVDPDTLAPVARVDRPTAALIAVRAGTTRLIDNEILGLATHPSERDNPESNSAIT